MKSQGGISYSNAAVSACPKHLLQFAVDQRYDDYTSVDHAVWRSLFSHRGRLQLLASFGSRDA